MGEVCDFRVELKRLKGECDVHENSFRSDSSRNKQRQWKEEANDSLSLKLVKEHEHVGHDSLRAIEIWNERKYEWYLEVRNRGKREFWWLG